MGEEGGGGGEERGDLCVGARSKVHSLSASDFVMRPHCVAEMGRTLASLSEASCVGVQLEQKICRSSQAWNITTLWGKSFKSSNLASSFLTFSASRNKNEKTCR